MLLAPTLCGNRRTRIRGQGANASRLLILGGDSSPACTFDQPHGGTNRQIGPRFHLCSRPIDADFRDKFGVSRGNEDARVAAGLETASGWDLQCLQLSVDDRLDTSPQRLPCRARPDELQPQASAGPFAVVSQDGGRLAEVGDHQVGRLDRVDFPSGIRKSRESI